MNKGLYFLFLSIFLLYIAFAGFDGGEDIYVNWYPLNPNQSVTIQYYFWLLFLRAAMFLIFLAWYYESSETNKKMLKVLMLIHAWYLVEYVLHYTSVWVLTSRYSGYSSHILTMLVFAVYGWKLKE